MRKLPSRAPRRVCRLIAPSSSPPALRGSDRDRVADASAIASPISGGSWIAVVPRTTRLKAARLAAHSVQFKTRSCTASPPPPRFEGAVGVALRIPPRMGGRGRGVGLQGLDNLPPFWSPPTRGRVGKGSKVPADMITGHDLCTCAPPHPIEVSIIALRACHRSGSGKHLGNKRSSQSPYRICTSYFLRRCDQSAARLQLVLKWDGWRPF